ncbi:alpha/beta hydrolase family protein [Pseudomonas citronellolis]|uniref:alpha/beta hydrolase family protein n=1 Tax=Pseudomonas citronellolis TaxID=53408 RepID=UPI0023E365D5|nr:alpha/beta fold hydrolase [Pseudomonas citronellolis]MDF3931526.1 alpha/beta fold hydrolase [Pseudomonas citronellolis]
MSLQLSFAAADGYPLKGRLWRHAEPAATPRALVIVNPATSVRGDYYGRFAAYLHAAGFDVLCYDYRGIGESRPASLRGFQASWLDWGRLDFEGALRWAAEHCPGQPLHVVAHSVGGFLVGLAPSNSRIERVFSMGAQFAHWRDYQRQRRLRMLLKWHLAMPLLSGLLGYFPGKRLGWMEDTPRGVVRDWTQRSPRFEDAYRRGPQAMPERQRAELVESFAGLRGATLALSVTDDEFGTRAAIERLLGYYRNSPRLHLRLPPEALGLRSIGHFAFFHSRFEANLWPIALRWLRDGEVETALNPYLTSIGHQRDPSEPLSA